MVAHLGLLFVRCQVAFHYLICQGHYHLSDWLVFYADCFYADCICADDRWEADCHHLFPLDHPHCPLRHLCLQDEDEAVSEAMV